MIIMGRKLLPFVILAGISSVPSLQCYKRRILQYEIIIFRYTRDKITQG